MPVIRVDLSEFNKELDKLTTRQLKQFKQAAVVGVAKSIPDLVRASPVDTGLYAQSWDFTADEKEIIIGNYAPYAGIIEDGARPFTPPLAPLLAWAKRVLRSKSQPPSYEPQVWALAVGTQKKIAREGMKPRHILANAIPGIIENMKREFAKIG